MRVIGGCIKGHSLKLPSNREIRPSSDRTRESIFNLLGPHINGETVLDLFAGTGALGIEALSRGYDLGVFVENDRIACKLIRENLEHCDLLEKSRLESCSASTYLERMDEAAPFDLILADPPYHKGLLCPVLLSIARPEWISKEGLVVLESEKNLKLPVETGCIKCVKRRQYGDACIHVYMCL